MLIRLVIGEFLLDTNRCCWWWIWRGGG